MKKNKIKNILLSSLGLMTIVATPLIATSCSKTNMSSNSALANVKTIKYKSSIETTNKANRQDSSSSDSTSTNNPKEKLILDPNLSDDAKNKVNDTFKDGSSITKEKLQLEYDKVLTKFYKMYEYESKEDKKTEVEAEIKGIVVEKFDKDTLSVNLKVTYEVETEKKDDKDKKDKDKENKVTEIHDKTVTLKPTFASEMEIAHITETLKSIKDGNWGSGKSEIDVKDLYELYVGDKEDGKESIFEKTNSILSVSKFGGLLGYELDLLELAYVPKATEKPKSAKINKVESNTNKKESFKIFAPSYVINHFYVPEKNLENGLDLTLNYNTLKQKTWEEIKAIKDESSLSQILKNPPTTQENKNLIVKVEAKEKEEKPNTAPTPTIKKETSTEQTPSTPTQPTTKKDIVLEITVKKSKDSQETILVVLEIKNEWLKKTTTTPPSKPE